MHRVVSTWHPEYFVVFVTSRQIFRKLYNTKVSLLLLVQLVTACGVCNCLPLYPPPEANLKSGNSNRPLDHYNSGGALKVSMKGACEFSTCISPAVKLKKEECTPCPPTCNEESYVVVVRPTFLF